MWRLTSVFSEERVWGSEIIKMPLKPKAKNRTNAYNTRAVSSQRPLKMSILDNVYKTWSWRYLMKHVKDILLALISHNVFCIWSDGANVKPWFKTEGKKKKINITFWFESRKSSVQNQYCELPLHVPSYLFRSSNTSGRRKLSRDHSSDRLFCRGVPVSSSLLSDISIFSSCTSRQFKFLILWPSSTII